MYLRLAPGDMGVEVAAGSPVLLCSGLVGEAEPVLVLTRPRLERFMLGRPDPDTREWGE